MSKVFISYSHKDKEWVINRLLPGLEKSGIKIHIDFRDFKIGLPALVNMENAIKECDKTILVLTPHWLESEWTNFEAMLLQTKDPAGLKGSILPLMLEKCELPQRLSIFTCANFMEENNRESELSLLLNQLGIIVEQEKTGEEESCGKLPGKICLSKLPVTGPKVFGRENELEILDKAWADEHTHIVTLVAWGGVGKTALVNHWLNLMEQKHYCRAQKVYGWSFYSQGAKEGTQASADEFFLETLTWFGDSEPEKGSNVEKARRLA